jgi:pimeloyl-ACP methyl ester carboxylesterase
MFIKRYGTGQQLYFGLHGWSGDHLTFAPLEKLLPANAALLSVDLPGFGTSPALREYTLETVSREISKAIKQSGDQVTVIGNCSGGLLALVALDLDAELQRFIKRLVLIDPFAYFPWYFSVFVSSPAGRYAYYSTFANPVGRWLTNLSLKKHRVEGASLTSSFTEVNHALTYRYLQMLYEIGHYTRFHHLRLPIDIVCGEKTFGAIRTSARLWQSIWPQARHFELKGAGHLPIEEAAVRLSEIIFEHRIGETVGSSATRSERPQFV